MIQKDHIKYEREYQGKSLRMIAQETSYDFRTVKKYADCDDWNEPIPRKRRGRPTVLDLVKPIIDQWLVEDLLENLMVPVTKLSSYQVIDLIYIT